MIARALFCAARTRLFHLQPPQQQQQQQQQPDRGDGAAAAALQRDPVVGDDRGAAVSAALQEGPTHQKVHQDCSTVSSSHSEPAAWPRALAWAARLPVQFETITFKRACCSLKWWTNELHVLQLNFPSLFPFSLLYYLIAVKLRRTSAVFLLLLWVWTLQPSAAWVRHGRYGCHFFTMFMILRLLTLTQFFFFFLIFTENSWEI